MSAVLMSVVAALTLSQVNDSLDAGPHDVPPMSANPDNTASDVARTSGLEDGGFAETAPLTDGVADAGMVADIVPPPGTPAPAPAGPDDGVEGKIGASLRLSETLVSWFPVDDVGTYVGPRPFEMRLRVAPEVHFKGFGAVAEFDAATGAVAGNVPQTGIADRVPVPNFQPLELRQLLLEYKWQSGIFRVGQQTSSWGLGILANPGAKDAEAGEFGQQHFGNLTYRALLAGRPLFGLGGNYRAFEVIAAADLIVRDNFADYSNGDRAFQGVLALRFKQDDDRYVGVYGVYRRQRAVGVTDGGRATDVFVIDVAAKWHFLKREDRQLSVGFEAATILGTTTQTRAIDAQISQVRQFGAAAKINYRYRSATVFLDWGYTSGDQNPYDDRVESFRFDRDYKVGLVLFDQVLAYQSARAGFRASDPNLTGLPPEGVQFLPTGGSVYNAWYLFPRVKYAFADWLDLYGGPLFAFSTAKLTDPFNSKVGGGSSINFLGGNPGGYLGTELDIGLQGRWKPHRLLTITATLEGGIFLPGDSFAQSNGANMGPVGLGRLRLGVAL